MKKKKIHTVGYYSTQKFKLALIRNVTIPLTSHCHTGSLLWAVKKQAQSWYLFLMSCDKTHLRIIIFTCPIYTWYKRVICICIMKSNIWLFAFTPAIKIIYLPISKCKFVRQAGGLLNKHSASQVKESSPKNWGHSFINPFLWRD